MIYNDMAVIIPALATVYLLAIYVLLILAQRTAKGSGYIANSASDVVVPYVGTDTTQQIHDVDTSPNSTLPEV